MKPSLSLAASLVSLLPLTGCCTMARLFCGPDRTPWVPIAHDTARATLATFLEAVRRDDPLRVYQCLAPSYIRANDLDYQLVTAFWERLCREVPAHMLGYAELPAAPIRIQDDGVTYAIEIEGRVLHIDLVRQSFWEVRYRAPDGSPRETSRNLDFASLNGFVAVTPQPEDPADGTPRSRVMLRPLEVEHPATKALRLEDVDSVTVGREWKIAAIGGPAAAAAR